MKILSVQQGSPEWLALRAAHRPASEAPAMMGVSTRAALIQRRATDITPEVTAGQQYQYNRGHRAELVGRARAELMLGQDLFPVVAESDDGYLMASFDGLTADGAVCFECKLWGKSKAASVAANLCPPKDYPQVQQQLLISGADYCLYMLADADDETKQASMQVYPDLEYQQQIIAGWRQLDKDVANYTHTPAAEVLTGEPVATLPTIVYKLYGLALTSNLDEYKQAALQLVESSKKPLETDQDFANCEMQIKAFREAEQRIKVIRAQVVGEVLDIDKFQRELGDIGELFRQAALNREKQVKSRKDAIKQEIFQKAQRTFEAHVIGLNQKLGYDYMPAIPLHLNEVSKGLKTRSSLENAVNTELARAMVEADQIFELIDRNLHHLMAGATGYEFLFLDTGSLVQMDELSFVAIMEQRIRQYEAAEKAKAIAEVEQAKAYQPDPETEVIKLAPTTTINRPPDLAIIYAVESYYRVTKAIAIEWIKGIDFEHLDL